MLRGAPRTAYLMPWRVCQPSTSNASLPSSTRMISSAPTILACASSSIDGRLYDNRITPTRSCPPAGCKTSLLGIATGRIISDVLSGLSALRGPVLVRRRVLRRHLIGPIDRLVSLGLVHRLRCRRVLRRHHGGALRRLVPLLIRHY